MAANMQVATFTPTEAIEILRPFIEDVPYLKNYFETAIQVLKENDVDIEKLVE